MGRQIPGKSVAPASALLAVPKSLEVRFHGRGGMGAVVASQLLAQASFLEGRWAQSFPFFGVARRGGGGRGGARTNGHEPHIVVVLDPSLLKGTDFLAGLPVDGVVVANTGG